ncbi:hypothetical protein H696_02900 [Fonticula alba]|uniref:Uncharacterized protein n=1 Tax=Fonticula alba TaxID=691883 RepID=A0A058Z8D8_FONAL|nr:hypothetical protein H696_02900 [Fonticula alba]KCV70554.1 hypothetical protein H696_02900 [Fonticula alba]|eukprot:XP_009495070.1 hypothetical protein H696_02900 [Fonticula alba]
MSNTPQLSSRFTSAALYDGTAQEVMTPLSAPDGPSSLDALLAALPGFRTDVNQLLTDAIAEAERQKEAAAAAAAAAAPADEDAFDDQEAMEGIDPKDIAEEARLVKELEAEQDSASGASDDRSPKKARTD